MKYKKLLYLTWLIPVFLLVLMIQQAAVYYGISKTMAEGELHTAYVTDFRIKQIAAQTNGYMDLMFTDNQGNRVEERLSLHVQHASRFIGANEVEIRYRAGATHDIVMTSTFDYQRNTVLINLAVIGLSLLVLIPVSIFATRYARGAVKNMRDDNFDLDIVKT